MNKMNFRFVCVKEHQAPPPKKGSLFVESGCIEPSGLRLSASPRSAPIQLGVGVEDAANDLLHDALICLDEARTALNVELAVQGAEKCRASRGTLKEGALPA